MSQAVVSAWIDQRTADPHKYGLNRYPDFLRLDMVQALTARHGLQATNYAPLAGSGEVGNVLAAALLRVRGAEVIQPWPIDDPISSAARAWGATVRRVALNRAHGQDLDAGHPRRAPARRPGSSTSRIRTTPAGRRSARPSRRRSSPRSRSARPTPTCGSTKRTRATPPAPTSPTASL